MGTLVLLPAGYLKGVACVVIAATLLSCVSTTGTKTTLTTAELSKIRKAGILVESENPLSVRVARDTIIIGGPSLLGTVFTVAAYSKDAEYGKEIGRVLPDFDPVKESAAALHEKFTAGKVFPLVEIVQTDSANALKEQGFDAVFKETIEEWGLRLCSGEENVRVDFDLHAQLVLLQNNTTVWERDELFMEGPCRPLSDFRSDGELLRASLTRATETLAGKIANEIAFPYYTPESGKRSPLSTINPLAISLQVEDQRPPGEQDSVGEPIIGLRIAKMVSDKDPTAILYNALIAEFENNGHRIVKSEDGKADAVIKIALKRYWSDRIRHYFDIEMKGTLDTDIAILNGIDQNQLVSKPFNSTYRGSFMKAFVDFNSALKGALLEFIRSFSRDPNVLDALRSVALQKEKG